VRLFEGRIAQLAPDQLARLAEHDHCVADEERIAEIVLFIEESAITRLGIDAVEPCSTRPAALGLKVDVAAVDYVGVEGVPLVCVLAVFREPILYKLIAVQ